MTRIALGWLAMILVLIGLGNLHADEKGQQILEQAMQAHGAATLEKQPAATWKGKGTIHLTGMSIPFTGQWALAGPDRIRIDISMEIAGDKIQVLNILSGKQGWTVFNGTVNDLDEEAYAEMRELTHVNWAQSLFPLKDKAYTVQAVPDVQVDGRTARGIKVTREGFRDFTIYFDAQTHLLAKCVCQAKDEETRQLVEQEEFYSGYKDINGMKVPMTLRIKRAGKDFLEAETSEFQPAQKLDDKLFQKPAAG